MVGTAKSSGAEESDCCSEYQLYLQHQRSAQDKYLVPLEDIPMAAKFSVFTIGLVSFRLSSGHVLEHRSELRCRKAH